MFPKVCWFRWFPVMFTNFGGHGRVGGDTFVCCIELLRMWSTYCLVMRGLFLGADLHLTPSFIICCFWIINLSSNALFSCISIVLSSCCFCFLSSFSLLSYSANRLFMYVTIAVSFFNRVVSCSVPCEPCLMLNLFDLVFFLSFENFESTPLTTLVLWGTVPGIES